MPKISTLCGNDVSVDANLVCLVGEQDSVSRFIITPPTCEGCPNFKVVRGSSSSKALDIYEVLKKDGAKELIDNQAAIALDAYQRKFEFLGPTSCKHLKPKENTPEPTMIALYDAVHAIYGSMQDVENEGHVPQR